MIVSAIALARELWRYGEDDLWTKALTLAPADMLEVGSRTAELLGSKGIAIWPDGPRGSRPVLLAGIEYLEGEIRPASRNRGRDTRELPSELHASEATMLAAADEVAKQLDRRRRG